MQGEAAVDLIRSLDRNNVLLPPYLDDKVRHVFQDCDALYQKNREDVERLYSTSDSEAASPDETRRMRPVLEWRHSLLERNKRCLLAYHYNRLGTVRRMRWEFGPVLPPDLRSNLSTAESRWFNDYSNSLAKYMKAMNVDLLQDRQPPKTLYTQVQCLKDHGEFESSTGTVVQLKKNTQHCLLRSDCEQLIRQGIVKHVL